MPTGRVEGMQGGVAEAATRAEGAGHGQRADRVDAGNEEGVRQHDRGKSTAHPPHAGGVRRAEAAV